MAGETPQRLAEAAQKKPTGFLVTVGISLADNLQRELQKSGQGYYDKDSIFQDLCCYYNLAFSSFWDSYTSSELSSVNFPSAEIQSFLYWLEQNYQQVDVKRMILLPTETPEAKKCAEQVKRILSNGKGSNWGVKEAIRQSWEKVRDIEIKAFSIDMSNQQGFIQGVENFLELTRDLIDEMTESGIRRTILNITGGYKGLIPIFSLFGFLEEDVEVIYQHEKEEMVVRVPPLPLGWDLKLLDEYRSLMKGRDQLDTQPPVKFQLLFEKQNNSWIKSAFGNFVEKIYEQDRTRRFGHGARLMKLLREKNENLFQELERKTRRWEHLWIGDQIPETVEHSRGHSLRLLELGADLLEPIFKDCPDFLSPVELYLLICSIWLHDIGHAELEYKLKSGKTIPVALFPSLVRKWHGLLSYQRIKRRDDLEDDEKEAIALICKYHRRNKPLEGIKPWKDKIFDEVKVDPLAKVLNNKRLYLNEEDIPSNRMLLIAALLRVLDGCDVQSDRVVDESYWNERKKRTKEEIDHYLQLFESKKSLLSLIEDCNKRAGQQTYGNIIQNLMDKIKSLDFSKCKSYREFDEKCEGYEKQILELLKEAMGKDDPEEREILIEVLSPLNRIFFKKIQEAHFEKHSKAKLVYLSRANKDFRIEIIFAQDAEKRDKTYIANGIWKEVKAVKGILDRNNICFAGVYSEGQKLAPSEEKNRR